MSQPLDPVAALAAHRLFEGLSHADLKRLAEHLHRRHFDRGENVFLKGDRGDSLMLVARGRIKISTSSAEGREAIINVITPGEVFGEMALLDGGTRSAHAWALDESELLTLARVDLIHFLDETPGAALQMMAVLTQRLRRTTELVEDAVFLDLPQRLARRLIWMASSESADENGVIKLKVSQEQLGFIAGASRESINRELRRWQDQDWVQLRYGAVNILDLEALQDFAEAGEE